MNAPKSTRDNTLYVRLPPSLKASVVKAAALNQVSANVFALRALEAAVNTTESAERIIKAATKGGD